MMYEPSFAGAGHTRNVPEHNAPVFNLGNRGKGRITAMIGGALVGLVAPVAALAAIVFGAKAAVATAVALKAGAVAVIANPFLMGIGIFILVSGAAMYAASKNAERLG